MSFWEEALIVVAVSALFVLWFFVKEWEREDSDE